MLGERLDSLQSDLASEVARVSGDLHVTCRHTFIRCKKQRREMVESLDMCDVWMKTGFGGRVRLSIPPSRPGCCACQTHMRPRVNEDQSPKCSLNSICSGTPEGCGEYVNTSRMCCGIFTFLNLRKKRAVFVHR